MVNKVKESVINFLGEDGIKYFKNIKEEHGTCWFYADGIHNWTTIGRDIRNHILDKFPDFVKELGDYEEFEDFVYTLIEEMIE